jgi:hypothetical protein
LEAEGNTGEMIIFIGAWGSGSFPGVFHRLSSLYEYFCFLNAGIMLMPDKKFVKNICFFA